MASPTTPVRPGPSEQLDLIGRSMNAGRSSLRAVGVVAISAGAVAGSLAVPGIASAHEGHETSGWVSGLTHPVFGLDHLLAMVAIGVLAAFAGSRRAAIAVPLAFVGGMVLGGLVGFATGTSAAVELAIALSVVALGVAVVAGRAATGAALPAVAAVFGSLHGQAHGAEIPVGAVPVAYVIGFVATTLLLHLGGAALGVGLRRVPVGRLVTGSAIAAAGVAVAIGA